MQTAPASDAMITELFDALPESVLWLKPVWSRNNQIVDFTVAYCNHGASQLLQTSKEILQGQRLLQTTIVEEDYKKLMFDQCLQIWETGKPQEESYYSPRLGRYFNALRSKILDGIVSVTRDCTEFYLSEQERLQQTHLINSILDASTNGIFYCEAIRNTEAGIVDLQFKKINQGFTNLLHLAEGEVLEKNYLSFFPASLHNGLFALNCQVIETGMPMRKEVYYQGDGIDAWYDVSLVKLGQNGLVVTFADITSSKLHENAIKQSEGRLRTVINTSQSGMFTLVPITNERGEITDFHFGLVNQAVATYIGETAENLTGALASIYFPAYKTNGLFNIYKETYLQNKEHQFDFHYEDGYDVYFNIHTIKTGNEVLVTFTDHTTLKRLQAQLENSIEDLKRSKVNLEEFAYAASHDLQEQLRKINFFAERLHNNIHHLLSEEDQKMFERMDSATARMRTLIEDLLTYSKFSMPTAVMEDVLLQHLVQQALTDLEATINEKGATLTIDPLPQIKGDERQLR